MKCTQRAIVRQTAPTNVAPPATVSSTAAAVATRTATNAYELRPKNRTVAGRTRRRQRPQHSPNRCSNQRPSPTSPRTLRGKFAQFRRPAHPRRAYYVRPHVLVVDEVGYLTYGDEAANVLYHVVNDRPIRRRAMIFTTNKHPKHWGHVLHDEDLAEAIVDRILERGRLLRLDGPSVRTKHLSNDELDVEIEPTARRRFSGKPTAEFPEPTRDTLSDCCVLLAQRRRACSRC